MDVGLNLRDLMSSGRLLALLESLGVSRFEATGVLAFFYEATQDAELVRAPLANFDAAARVKLRPYRTETVVTALVAAGLADDHGDGTYTIRGNEAHVAKLRTYRERAAKGGHMRARKLLEAASKQPASKLVLTSSSPGDWLLDQDPGSNTADPPPSGEGVPPQGGPLSLEGLREAASMETDSRPNLQPGMDTETNARPTRQLEGFALAMMREVWEKRSPPLVAPATWDRQHHRDIARLVGRYPKQEQWRAIFEHYAEPRYDWCGHTTEWLAKHVDEVAQRALGTTTITEDPFEAGRRMAEEMERKEREEREKGKP